MGLLREWVAAGQDPSQFWNKTLRVIFVVLEGSAERDRRDHNDRAWLAHTTAMLTSYAPKKPSRFTKLEKLLTKRKVAGRERVRSWEEDFAILSSWASGGKPH